MNFIFSINFIILAFCLCFKAEALKCYECFDARNEKDCSSQSTLFGCSTGYDVCQTEEIYTAAYGLRITKKCAVSPCHLPDVQSHALGLNCDKSQSSWTCSTCCNTDGCNSSSKTVCNYIMICVAAVGLLLLQIFLIM